MPCPLSAHLPHVCSAVESTPPCASAHPQAHPSLLTPARGTHRSLHLQGLDCQGITTAELPRRYRLPDTSLPFPCNPASAAAAPSPACPHAPTARPAWTPATARTPRTLESPAPPAPCHRQSRTRQTHVRAITERRRNHRTTILQWLRMASLIACSMVIALGGAFTAGSRIWLRRSPSLIVHYGN